MSLYNSVLSKIVLGTVDVDDRPGNVGSDKTINVTLQIVYLSGTGIPVGDNLLMGQNTNVLHFIRNTLPAMRKGEQEGKLHLRDPRLNHPGGDRRRL